MCFARLRCSTDGTLRAMPFRCLRRRRGGKLAATVDRSSTPTTSTAISPPGKGWEGDLKGKTVGGLGRLAGAIAQARKEAGEGVLLLDAGDLIGDTMIADLTQGKALIAALNYLRYDALTVGNHEPDFGTEALRERMGDATFPTVAANLVERKSGKLFTKPYVDQEGGRRVRRHPRTGLPEDGVDDGDEERRGGRVPRPRAGRQDVPAEDAGRRGGSGRRPVPPRPGRRQAPRPQPSRGST